MYIPKHFEQPDITDLHEFIEAHPFATLVTLNPEGLNGDHLPMLLQREPSPYGTLAGHVALANPVWQFAEEKEVLVIFSGPAAYISPSWYATKADSGKVVPTWNYAVVHAYGKVKTIRDPQWLKAHVEALTNRHESKFTDPWAVSDAPADFMELLLRNIVGIEIVIAKLTGKWKLGQNRSRADRAGVLAGLRERGADDIADMIERAKCLTQP